MCQVAVLPAFQTHNDICWYVKVAPRKANGPSKSKVNISPRTGDAKLGKKSTWSGFTGSVTEGYVSYLKAPEAFTLQVNCRREVLYKGADKLYIATVRR